MWRDSSTHSDGFFTRRIYTRRQSSNCARLWRLTRMKHGPRTYRRAQPITTISGWREKERATRKRHVASWRLRFDLTRKHLSQMLTRPGKPWLHFSNKRETPRDKPLASLIRSGL